MSFRKPRVHLTGKSNADARTISANPLKGRVPLMERSFVQNSSLFVEDIGNPIENTMQKYKTWNKRMKGTNVKPEEKKIVPERMQEDPPDYANVQSRVKSLRLQQAGAAIGNSKEEELKNHLKKNGFSLNSQFLKVDKGKKGVVSYEDFKEILDNSQIPERLRKCLPELYKELGGDQEGLKYREISEKFDSVKTPRLPHLDFNNYAENLLRVIDKKTAPLNQLENIYNNARGIRQFLKTTFQSPETLLKNLQDSNPANHISMEKLKNFVIDKANELKTHKISKREMEGFLSSYDYNKDAQTSISEIVKYVFMDDILAASYLHGKKRAIPPLRESCKSDFDIRRLKDLLLRIEEKMFVQGPLQSLSVFRSFDKDNDGYITVDDIKKELEMAQVDHVPQDVTDLMSFLDEQKKGYLTFDEFSKRIQPNILTANYANFEESYDKHFNISQPSSKYCTFQKSKLSIWKPADAEEHKLKYSTRYSASPSHQDTFVNFAPKPGSAMFVPDNERFSSKKFDPINISHEDKNKLRKSTDARIIYLQQTRESNENRIKVREEKDKELDSKKINCKARVKNEYEAKCKAGLMN